MGVVSVTPAVWQEVEWDLTQRHIWRHLPSSS